MRYLLMIYVDPSTYEGMSEEQSQAEMGEYFALSRWLSENGGNAGSEALHPVESATTVRVREGKLLTTDGPFAETKEHLGGIYLVDVDDLDAAIEIARRIPDVNRGSVEIRPCVDFSAA